VVEHQLGALLVGVEECLCVGVWVWYVWDVVDADVFGVVGALVVWGDLLVWCIVVDLGGDVVV